MCRTNRFGYNSRMSFVVKTIPFFALFILGCTAPDAPETGMESEPDPFADLVASFNPGDFAGFGQDRYPDVVLGPPQGQGPNGGSLHVLSLGNQGEITLGFDDIPITDGPGVDVIVFENAFPGWPELGVVSVSVDGEIWHEWPCDPNNSEQQFPGCAGVSAVLSHPDNGVSPTDPDVAGGDGYDLADLGLSEAWFIRITDTGTNPYEGSSGGFDLDAVAVVHTVWDES